MKNRKKFKIGRYYEFNEDGGITKEIEVSDPMITFGDTRVVFSVSLPDKRNRHVSIDIDMKVILNELSKVMTWLEKKNKKWKH